MEKAQRIIVTMDSFENELYDVHAAICSILEQELNVIFKKVDQWCFSVNLLFLNIRIYPHDFRSAFKEYNKEIIKHSRKKNELLVTINVDFGSVSTNNSHVIFQAMHETIKSRLQEIERYVIDIKTWHESITAVAQLQLPEKISLPKPRTEIPE